MNQKKAFCHADNNNTPKNPCFEIKFFIATITYTFYH